MHPLLLPLIWLMLMSVGLWVVIFWDERVNPPAGGVEYNRVGGDESRRETYHEDSDPADPH